jgi:hypothetical protein
MGSGILARSKNYTIACEFEVIKLDRPIFQPVVIGDFYGDPTGAIIDAKEHWCVIIGCGLIIYFLREPFRPYEYNQKTDQWAELFRDPQDTWWIKTINQTGADTVRFVVEPKDNKHVGVYELNICNLSIQKIQ